MASIALFGTSADPPTRGHQAILHWLSQQFDQVAVWASDNPFKTHGAALDHRQVMLRLLIDEVNFAQGNVTFYPALSHPRTLDTLKQARQLWPQAGLTFVIGADLVATIATWYQIQDVLAQVTLLVIPRPGYSLTSADLQPLQKLGANVAIANFCGPAVSSTAVREADLAGLTPAVQAYIHQKGLYEWSNAAQGA